MTTQGYFVGIIAYALITSLAIFLLLRSKKDDPSSKGVGVRRIQFLTVVCTVPGLVVLRLYEKISADAVMALIGAVVGYVLSNIQNFKPTSGERNP